ncbi:MAG TPA: uroporphyrinogen-III C-methyltransferase [Cyclobacteriaceae bacterium]|jgi:uroporphyrin-III C-methyltransferase|nr:uroporphyrinogen-III C-methyltransferase [Cyclobacteriaceae bacterium]
MPIRGFHSKVVLAGAGPGDPELITVKTLKYLQTADVIVVDRLVNHSLLNNTKRGAKILFVGKEGGNANSFSQETINDLLVSEAKLAKLVLRLKGGDVSFFSNTVAELETLVANNIAFEIIPGVTAASGAAAYAGIPLTARGFSNSIRFLAYTHPEQIEDGQIRELALTDDTLVFYMSSRTLPFLIDRLLENQISAEKWVAVVEQATTPYQKVFASSIEDFVPEFSERRFKSPSLVIIGKVAKFCKKFQWHDPRDNDENFFPSVDASFFTTAKVA